MASLLSRFVGTGFAAIAPVPNLTGLDGECNQLVGASGVLNGNSTASKLLVKTSDATDPPIIVDQVGAGALFIAKQNGTAKVTVANDGVTTFTAIPVGPASDPTTANQLVRKSYVDTRTVSFSAGFSIVDPANATLNSRLFGSFIIPAGGTYTIQRLRVMFREGSHTAGGSVTFTFDRSGVGDIGSINLDNTNNTPGVVYSNDIVDIVPAADAIFSVRISARSGTITETSVTAIIEGFRTVI